jgi:hypothetical protein
MEKLIELLNEYVKELWIWNYVWWHNKKTVENSDFIITKKFWFIKWLVDNDKIDLKELDKSERKPMYSFEEEWKLWFKLFWVYESLLMLLSIQDNPIDFLISILKDKKVRTVYVDKDWNVSWDTKRYTDC